METYSEYTDTMERNCFDHQEAFGFGPCGSYAALLRRRGLGRIAVCDYRLPGEEYGFGHFVIVDNDDRIVDMTNQFVGQGEYAELEIIPDDEMPDLVTEEEIAFWNERIAVGEETGR